MADDKAEKAAGATGNERSRKSPLANDGKSLYSGPEQAEVNAEGGLAAPFVAYGTDEDPERQTEGQEGAAGEKGKDAPGQKLSGLRH